MIVQDLVALSHQNSSNIYNWVVSTQRQIAIWIHSTTLGEEVRRGCTWLYSSFPRKTITAWIFEQLGGSLSEYAIPWILIDFGGLRRLFREKMTVDQHATVSVSKLVFSSGATKLPSFLVEQQFCGFVVVQPTHMHQPICSTDWMFISMYLGRFAGGMVDVQDIEQTAWGGSTDHQNWPRCIDLPMW